MNNLTGVHFRPTTGRLTTQRISKLCQVGMFYRAQDPWTVQFRFDVQTIWFVSRDYLTEGLLFESGMFNVRIRKLPGLVRIWQLCDSGWASLDVDDDVLAEFLAATKEIVPEGGEWGFCPDNAAALEGIA